MRVGFLLADRFTLSAFAGFVDVLRLAADEGDRSRPLGCTWTVLGTPGQPIRASCGIELMPQQPLASPEAFDYVVMVGGLLHGGQRLGRGVQAFLTQAARVGVPLVGVCTGSFVLARAGLLDGHVACVSWFHREEFAAAFPALHVVSNRQYVIDRDRITCAGGTSVVHLAAELVERHRGRVDAAKALRILITREQTPSRALQPEPVVTRPASDHVVQQAMLRLEQSVTEPEAIASVAASMGIGTRQLERRFQADLGLSPREFKRHLRFARARWLLENTDLSVTAVGLDCGFGDCSQFSRAFSRHFGARPTALRKARQRTG
ncbi:MAG: GlxA family transcriptional regulator [Burkholderiaceae bacterium]|nr:GlxA family transcriptional regulator [Burkholderiaceae bacterium]